MKFFVVFLLAVLAVSCVRSDSEECTEDRADTCVESLIEAILSEGSEKEKCSELRSSIDCLRNAVDDCVEETDQEIEEGLQELEKTFNEKCDSDDDIKDAIQETYGLDDEEMDEIEKCFEEHQEFIFECIPTGNDEALTVQEDQDLDEDAFKCTMYSVVTGCFVDRLGDKCGETAAKIAETEMAKKPQEIEAACEAAGEIEIHTFNLLDAKRKK